MRLLLKSLLRCLPILWMALGPITAQAAPPFQLPTNPAATKPVRGSAAPIQPPARQAGTKASAPKAKPPAAKPPSLARDPYLGAIVVDASDGRVLFEENADARGYPASVLKLMLLLTALEQIRDGTLSLQDRITISANAVSDEGADLRLREGETFTVEDLLYALMIHSANDAAIAVAEKLGGSLAGYLQISNRRARLLGMAMSQFHSASGLGPENPKDPHDVTTPRDLTLLCRELLKHPEALRFTSARARVFRPEGGADRIPMISHNYILDSVKGCDGLKTGYLRAAGYCLAGTAQRNGRRVIAVLLGATSEESRNKIAGKLIDAGFAVLAATR